MKRILTLLFWLIWCSCVGTRQPERAAEPGGCLSIDSIVQSMAGNELVLSLNLPELPKTADTPINDIAQQIIQKSLFLEGISTDINGLPAVIKEVRGNTVQLRLDKPQPFAVGTPLKLKIPKKTIALVDFDVIKGNMKEAGAVTLEGLTTALIDSGHFVVIERAKLKTIMNELRLSLSGLTREAPDKAIGKLLLADLILTGTLADMGGGIWDINLRLLDVRTGQAMAAIGLKTPMFKPSELRDAGDMNEDFEGKTLNPSWSIGDKKHGAFSVKLDPTQGAGQSKRSLGMDFNFLELRGKEDVLARMETMKKRDLSLYSGIEFYVKANPQVTGHFRILVSEANDPNTMDAWIASFTVTPDWSLQRIPFDQLVIGRGWVKDGAKGYGAKPGKQILDLSHVEAVSIGAYSKHNPPLKGSMWIDNVRFYTD